MQYDVISVDIVVKS